MSTDGTASNTSREIEVTNGSTMMARMKSRRQHTDAEGWPGEQEADEGNIAEGVDQKRLQGLLQDRSKNE